MLEFMDPMLFWATLALQLVGLVSVVLARLPRRCPLQCACFRTLFFGCLIGLAVATMVAIEAQSGSWAWCGTTFSVMAVGATLDLRSSMVVTGF
ncbi:hypothetical protein ETAA8_23440 [Anatilimnocola aggregata]|uniref:Uncharacterized protein n=1 Tax=Anatilimnocola aggregata TaxID=2528021 RepID=A0A517YAJ4_9BACT|nr:hypothetical protein [Anatilimnocola aggregata]QDU27257.1 hypothetical protein ETAA8_23440 [Anatilimnocola aggregata]